MKLGAFSISLSVKDIHKSKTFYETLGFIQIAGDISRNYLIMKNGNAIIGLFQDMFEGNIITFNPGWDENGQNTADFDDIRQIFAHLKSNDIQVSKELDTSGSGPENFSITDPDGNTILLDQHR